MLVRQTDIITAVPVIEHYFIQQTLYWGDSPPMRWAANNTKVIKYGKNQEPTKARLFMQKSRARDEKQTRFLLSLPQCAVKMTYPITRRPYCRVYR